MLSLEGFAAFFTHAITILSFFTYSVCDEKIKRHVNRDSYIVSSLILQSYFFKEECSSILESSNRKPRGCIEFFFFKAFSAFILELLDKIAIDSQLASPQSTIPI